jgi:ribose transport system permease protein
MKAIKVRRASGEARSPGDASSGADAGPAETRPAGGAQVISKLFAERWVLLWVWLLLIVVFAVLRPESFLTFGNAQTILGSQSTLAFVSLAVLFPLLVGEFDLSVGATLGLVTSVVAVLNVNLKLPIAVVVVLALLIGGLVGAVNGFFVVSLGVDGIITTLAVGTLATGVTYAITNYVTISGISNALVTVTTNQVLGVPYSFFYGIVAAGVIWYVLRYTPLGQYLLFVGRSRDVARLSGLNVTGIRFASFVAAGLFAGLAGIILAGTVGSADPTVGTTFLLPAYSAAFLGATTITPGRFNPLGTLVAVYFLVSGITGLQIMGLSDWVQQVFYGISLLFAVTVSVLARRRARLPEKRDAQETSVSPA